MPISWKRFVLAWSSLLQFDDLVKGAEAKLKFQEFRYSMGLGMDEGEVVRSLESKGLLLYYERIVEQLASMDQKAQAMVSLEGLLLALMAVFSTSIPSNQPARLATWATMVILLGSALCSLMVMRIRYGTTTIAKSKSVEEGLSAYKGWRDHKLKLHRAALTLLAIGLFGLVIVLSVVLL
jgi:hypothetical protein